jgi:ATP-dependent RNA helicase DHX29
VQHANARVIMDNWIKFKCDAPVAVLFKYLRLALDEDFAKRIRNAGKSSWSDDDDQIIVTIRRILDDVQ